MINVWCDYIYGILCVGHAVKAKGSGSNSGAGREGCL